MSQRAVSTHDARGPLTLACPQNKTCRRRLRHNVVAPTLAAPLLTDTRRSTVGSGTRENMVTEPEKKGRRPTSSVPDTYVVIQAGLFARFETHNGIRGGVVRRCVAHHVRSLLLLARRSLYVSDGTHIKRCSITRVFVTVWDYMENIGYHTFSHEFWVVPEEPPIVLTEGPVNPRPTGSTWRSSC